MLRGTYEHSGWEQRSLHPLIRRLPVTPVWPVLIPVMSNSGSGNQISTSVVIVFAEENGKWRRTDPKLLMLSHLTVIYIKQSLGRLSALCGCVVAATGSSCGITWLMDYNCVAFAVQNMIAKFITKSICDGAKPSCALKVTTGSLTAVLSAMMARKTVVWLVEKEL